MPQTDQLEEVDTIEYKYGTQKQENSYFRVLLLSPGYHVSWCQYEKLLSPAELVPNRDYF